MKQILIFFILLMGLNLSAQFDASQIDTTYRSVTLDEENDQASVMVTYVMLNGDIWINQKPLSTIQEERFRQRQMIQEINAKIVDHNRNIAQLLEAVTKERELRDIKIMEREDIKKDMIPQEE